MNLFNAIPSNFFNCLASGSNQRIYADCIGLIYREYEREISYRIPRNRLRDVLALYFLETKGSLSTEDYSGELTPNEMANAVLRKFLLKDIGWLEEEIDDSTFEKQIVMTEPGIALAEFLNQLQKPDKEEFSSYIYNIYNTLNNAEQWKADPYVDGIKHIYKNARALSKSLKKLSTFIRKIIEKMVQEETLEKVTENILEYCEGNFIREYSRLIKQQNIHIYRVYIKKKLDKFIADDRFIEKTVEACVKEEKVSREEGYDMVIEMIQATRRFLVEDYDKIMAEIKHKINLYLQIAIGRARFIRNKEHDIKNSVEKVMKYILEELEEIGMKEELPEEIEQLFLIDRHEFIDEHSLRFPTKAKAIKEPVEAELEVLTEETLERAREAQRKEAYNPYSRELMKAYLESQLRERREIFSEELPMESKRDLLANLSAVAYSRENGFRVEIRDGYYESNAMLLRKFKIVREKD